MFSTISIQLPGTMNGNIVNNEKLTCPYNSMESAPLQELRRREKGTCWLWKGMMVLWYQNIFWLCFAFYNKSLLLIKYTWDPGCVLDMIRQRRPEKKNRNRLVTTTTNHQADFKHRMLPPCPGEVEGRMWQSPRRDPLFYQRVSKGPFSPDTWLIPLPRQYCSRSFWQ